MSLLDPPSFRIGSVPDSGIGALPQAFDALSRSMQDVKRTLDEETLRRESQLIVAHATTGAAGVEKIFAQAPDIEQASEQAVAYIDTLTEQYDGTELGRRALRADLLASMRNASARASAQRLARERQEARASEQLRLEQLRREALAAADAGDEEGFALADLRMRVMQETASHLTPAEIEAARMELADDHKASALVRASIDRIRKDGAAAYLEDVTRLRTDPKVASPSVRAKALNKLIAAGSAILQKQNAERQSVLSALKRDMAMAGAEGADPLSVVGRYATKLDEDSFNEVVARYMPAFTTWVAGRVKGLENTGALAKVAEALANGDGKKAASVLRDAGENELADRIEAGRFKGLTTRLVASEIAGIVQESADRVRKLQVRVLADAGALTSQQLRELVSAGVLSPSQAADAARRAEDPARAVVIGALSGIDVKNSADSLSPAELETAAEKVARVAELIGDSETANLLGDDAEALTKRARITKASGLMFSKDIQWIRRAIRTGTAEEVGQVFEFLRALGIVGEPGEENGLPSLRLRSMSRNGLSEDELALLDEISSRAGFIDDRVLDQVRARIFEVPPSESRKYEKAEKLASDPSFSELLSDSIMQQLGLWEQYAPSILGGAPEPPPEMIASALEYAKATYARHGSRKRAAAEAAQQVLRDWTHDGTTWKFRPPELVYPKPIDPVSGEPVEGLPKDWWRAHLTKTIAKTFRESIMSDEERNAWTDVIRAANKGSYNLFGTLFGAVGLPGAGEHFPKVPSIPTPSEIVDSALSAVGLSSVSEAIGTREIMLPTTPDVVDKLIDKGVFRLVPQPAPWNENDPPGYWIEYDNPLGGTQYLMVGDKRFTWKPKWDADMRSLYAKAVGEATTDAVESKDSLLPDFLREMFSRDRMEHYWKMVVEENLGDVVRGRLDTSPDSRAPDDNAQKAGAVHEPIVPIPKPEAVARQAESAQKRSGARKTKGDAQVLKPEQRAVLDRISVSDSYFGRRGNATVPPPPSDPMKPLRTVGVSVPPDFLHRLDDPEVDQTLNTILGFEGEFRGKRSGDEDTNYGIQKSTLAEAREVYPDLPEDVRKLTPEQAKFIYARFYMGRRAPSGSLLFSFETTKNITGSYPLAFNLLDAVINHGPDVLFGWQRRLAARAKVKVDGVIGTNTLRAAESIGINESIRMLLEERAKRMRVAISRPGRAGEAEGLQARLRKVAAIAGIPPSMVPKLVAE